MKQLCPVEFLVRRVDPEDARKLRERVILIVEVGLVTHQGDGLVRALGHAEGWEFTYQQRVVWPHFLNTAPVLPVPNLSHDEQTIDVTMALLCVSRLPCWQMTYVPVMQPEHGGKHCHGNVAKVADVLVITILRGCIVDRQGMEVCKSTDEQGPLLFDLLLLVLGGPIFQGV